MSQPSPPSQPNPANTYAQGLQTFMKYLPLMLQKEYAYRGQYDPKFIEQQQGFEAKYGPRQREQQLAALDQLNPLFNQVYRQLGNQVSGYLNPNNPFITQPSALQLQTGREALLGTQLDPAFQTQLQSQIRARQALSDPTGAASASTSNQVAEAAFSGQAAQNLYSQRLQRAIAAGQFAAGQRQVPLSNAGQFLSTTSPVQQVNQIAPVSAPDAFRIVNPNAGYLGQQIGQQQYQNALAAYGMGNQGGGWMGALTGALGGAGQGAAMGGGYGAAAGAILGGVGGYFSDFRLKENIKPTNETVHGIPVVTFNYKGHKKPRIKGVIAQDVLRVRPDAVFATPSGFLGVRYDKLGIEPKVVN